VSLTITILRAIPYPTWGLISLGFTYGNKHLTLPLFANLAQVCKHRPSSSSSSSTQEDVFPKKEKKDDKQLSPLSSTQDSTTNIDDDDNVDIVGDVVRVHIQLRYTNSHYLPSFQLIPADFEHLQHHTHATICGTAFNCSQTDSTFELDVSQYTTYYKDKVPFPVKDYFNPNE
jgi:hypothetical protein